MLRQALTKRQLGALMLLGGAVGFLVIIVVDILDAGREGGIGPAQQIALGLMLILMGVGLTLIPLKDMPA